MAKKDAINRLRPQTDTVQTRYESQDRFVADWDKRQGEGQRIGRLQDRLAMGQKKTPLGQQGRYWYEKRLLGVSHATR